MKKNNKILNKILNKTNILKKNLLSKIYYYKNFLYSLNDYYY